MVRTVPHILANLEDVVHHEHVSNLLLVGHSLGASYAFLYAQQHLDNVCGLVLLEPSLCRDGTTTSCKRPIFY
ncbi:alpha/beta fold hydrolase [Lactiplantibacillus plantarum]